jgi:hypothetical protein
VIVPGQSLKSTLFSRLDEPASDLCLGNKLAAWSARPKTLPFAIRCRTCEETRETTDRNRAQHSTSWQLPS